MNIFCNIGLTKSTHTQNRYTLKSHIEHKHIVCLYSELSKPAILINPPMKNSKRPQGRGLIIRWRGLAGS
jgi:hypothetical protein